MIIPRQGYDELFPEDENSYEVPIHAGWGDWSEVYTERRVNYGSRQQRGPNGDILTKEENLEMSEYFRALHDNACFYEERYKRTTYGIPKQVKDEWGGWKVIYVKEGGE